MVNGIMTMDKQADTDVVIIGAGKEFHYISCR